MCQRRFNLGVETVTTRRLRRIFLDYIFHQRNSRDGKFEVYFLMNCYFLTYVILFQVENGSRGYQHIPICFSFKAMVSSKSTGVELMWMEDTSCVERMAG